MASTVITLLQSFQHAPVDENIGPLMEEVRVGTGVIVPEKKRCGRKPGWKKPVPTSLKVEVVEEDGFNCDTNFKGLSNAVNSAAHKRTQLGKKPFSCHQCSAKFAHSAGLNYHKKIHSGEKPFGCNWCPLKFRSSGNLVQHKRNVHANGKHELHKQGEVGFESSSQNNSTAGYETLVCADKSSIEGVQKEETHVIGREKKHCGRKPGWRKHIPIKVEDVEGDGFNCDTNFKGLSNAVTSAAHKRTHLGEKPYSCHQCSAKFLYASSLCYHKKIHSGEKPYGCNQCSARFISSGNLTNHERVHSDKNHIYRGYKPKRRQLKYENLSQNGSTDEKKTLHHTNKSRIKDIKTKRKVTNCAKKCKIVPVNNKFNIKVKFLSKRRRFCCDQCSKQVTTFRSLVIHKRTHSGEKPFACDLCPAKFPSNSALFSHKKRHSMHGALYVYHERKKQQAGNSFMAPEGSLTSANSQLFNKNSSQTASGSSLSEREIGNADVLEGIASSSLEKKFASSPREKKIANSSPARKIANSSPARKIASSYPDKKIIGSDSKKGNAGKSLEKEKNIYSCTECNKTFSWLASLLYHLRIHTGERTYDCKKCEQKFSSMSDLFMHKKTHICGKNDDGSQFTEERIMPPPSSPLVHRTNNCLEKDERRSVVETEFDNKLCMQDGADENESYSCSQCNKQFQKKHGLRIHMYQAHRRKNENESYSCSQCNKQFPKKHGLQIHMYQAHRRKNENESYSCSQCNKQFPKKHGLQIHMYQAHRRKNENESYSCSQCNKQFPKKHGLRIHMCRAHQRSKILPPIHPGMKKSIKRFNCDLCCKKFSYESAVNIHKKYIHKLELNADKYEVQEIVSSGISGKAKACKKIKTCAEAKISLYECDKCKKRFNTSRSLKNHMRWHSNTRLYKCKKCCFGFLNPVYLRWHKCKDSIIEREKCNSEDLVISVNDQTAENTFDCEHCNKQFISAHHLKSHMHVHAGEKLFSCSICSMKFLKACTLRSHEKRKHSIWKSQILDHMPKKLNVRSCDDGFECLECRKKFKSIGEFNRHSVVHTRIKAYKCDMCERKFAFHSNLYRHKRVNHSIMKPRSGGQSGIQSAEKISLDDELHGGDPDQIRHSIRKKENFYNSHIRIESVFGSYQDWKTEEPIEQLRLDSNSRFVCVRCSRDFPCVSSLEMHSKSCVFSSDDRPLNFEEMVKQEVEDDGPSAFLDARSNAIPYYCDRSSIKTNTDDRDSGISVGHHQNTTSSLCDRSSVDTVMDDRDPQISVGDLVMKQEIEEAPLWKPYGCGKCCASYATKEEAVNCFRFHGDD